MPVGEYTIYDGHGREVGVERFRAAAAMAGWRYVAEIETALPTPHHETVDLIVADGVPVRVRIETGEHALLVAREGDRLVGARDGEPLELLGDVDYLSPCFNAYLANRLRDTADARVTYLAPVTLEPRDVEQRYERVAGEDVETPVGRFAATRWRYAMAGSPRSWDLWVAGDLVVRYDGYVELRAYEPGATGPFPRSWQAAEPPSVNDSPDAGTNRHT